MNLQDRTVSRLKTREWSSMYDPPRDGVVVCGCSVLFASRSLDGGLTREVRSQSYARNPCALEQDPCHYACFSLRLESTMLRSKLPVAGWEGQRGLVERSLELFPIFQGSQYQSFVLLAAIQEVFPFRPGAR
jgi:hypothetical protein